MQELSSQQSPRTELSFQNRLYIVQTMNGLPPAQFEELCFALNPPKGVVPSNSAPQGERTTTLLNWAEGPTGPGLIVVDQGLQLFVPKITQPEQSPNPTAFAVSGKMGDLSPEELEAIVQLLRQKTGDDSIELAFITKGSIKLVLNGSPEGLEKLQEIFDSGELTNALEGRAVEYVHSIKSDTTEARKARLVQVLRLNTERNNLTRTLALDLVRALGQFLDIPMVIAIQFGQSGDQGRAPNRNQALKLTIELAQDLNQFLDRDRDRSLALALEQFLDRDPDRDRALNQELSQKHIVPPLSPDRDRALDLKRTLDQFLGQISNIDLRHADLSGTNLRNLDLQGLNLKGADLTDADVTETLFGDNPGLTESDKRDLQRRGAIFQDPPSSDVPSLVVR